MKLGFATLLVIALGLPGKALGASELGGRGSYAVGLRTVTYSKPSETTGEPRQLETSIWYPAEPGTGRPEQGGEVLRDADVLGGRWPLVLFSHGSCGFPGQSPFYTEGLASWGFVVAAPRHPGNTTYEFPDCETPDALADSFANRVADIRHVLDEVLAAATDRGAPFYRRIDPRRIGMSGHSFGGQTTLRVAAEEARVTGAIALAPAVGPGLESLRIASPAMVLGAELDSLTPFESASRDAYALLTGPRFLVELLNTGHCAFAVLCAPTLCGAGCEPGTESLDDTHRRTLHYAVPFLLHYVAGRPGLVDQLLPENAPAGVHVEAAVPEATRRGGPRPLPSLRRGG